MSMSSLLQPLKDIYNSTLERVGIQLDIPKDVITNELHQVVFGDYDNFNRKGNANGRGDVRDTYYKIAEDFSSCDNAGPTDMASRLYYRINVPWYLNTLKVKLNSLDVF